LLRKACRKLKPVIWANTRLLGPLAAVDSYLRCCASSRRLNSTIR